MSTGFLQHLDFGAAGGAVSGTLKTTGGNWDDDAAKDWDFSIGGTADPKHGIVKATGSCTYLPSGATPSTFINYGLRASMTSPTITGLVFEGGTDSVAFKHDYAYLNRIALSGRIGENLQCSFDWMALQPSVIAVPSWQTLDTNTTYEWFQAATNTLDGSAAMQMQSFELAIENNVRIESDLDTGKVTNKKRWGQVAYCGSERVTCTVTCIATPSSARLDEPLNDIPDGTATWAASFTNAASQTLTIACANLTLVGRAMPFTLPDSTVVHTFRYEGKPNTANTVVIS
jgi:hypothetical protein